MGGQCEGVYGRECEWVDGGSVKGEERGLLAPERSDNLSQWQQLS